MGEFVDRGAAEQPANARDAFVGAARGGGPIDAVREVHRAQLVNGEHPLEPAGAALGEDDRAAIFDKDRQRCERQNGQREQQERSGEQHIEHASNSPRHQILAINERDAGRAAGNATAPVGVRRDGSTSDHSALQLSSANRSPLTLREAAEAHNVPNWGFAPGARTAAQTPSLVDSAALRALYDKVSAPDDAAEQGAAEPA